MATKTHLVDTVADLTSTTENPKADLIDGQQITVAGYYAAGDKEAVTYVWNAASTATADGGSVLAHDEGGDGRFLLAKDTITARDFGAVGDGVADDTDVIKAWVDYLIENNKAGVWNAGDYKIREGVLSFDNNQEDKNFPVIFTEGYRVTRLIASGTNNAPLISITNGTSLDGGYRYWRQGGILNGITFLDETGDTAADRCGLSLQGCWGLRFGPIVGITLRSSVVHIPYKIYGASNPDPYADAFLYFERIEAQSCVGNVLRNDNGQGFTSSHVDVLRSTTSQGLFGLGSGNTFDKISFGDVTGWAIDDGSIGPPVAFTPSRVIIGNAELDNVERGMRLNRTTELRTERLRFVHRYQFGANTSADYWPLETISLNPSSGLVRDVEINAVHRIESGGTKGELASFLNLNNTGNNVNVVCRHRVIDNAGFGFVDSDFYSNVGGPPVARVFVDGKLVYNTIPKGIVLARPTTSAVGTAGWGTATAKIVCGTEIKDDLSMYNSTTGEATIQSNGDYRVQFKIMLSATAGTLVKVGIIVVRSETPSILAAEQHYSDGSTQSYSVSQILQLLSGDIVYPIAVNSDTSQNIVAPNSLAADTCFQIEKLSM